MNNNTAMEATKLLPSLKANIDEFVGEAPQFDDITMLMFDYKKEKELVVSKTFMAEDSELNNVLGFLEEELEKYECSMKNITAICVAIEEIFVNVAHYAYGTGKGDCDFTIKFNKTTRDLTMVMEDKGTPFNPLAKKDPDVSLPAEQREIGGLGIFIVKKTMDEVSYRYENDKNILTMKKKI
jgi:sigma-B regulation protein RsbU (phosphoserine phosphatase)